MSSERAVRSRFPMALMSVLIGGVLLLALTLTWAFLSMRSVLDVGGSCADGGPYVSAQSCPGGAGFIAFAIPLMIVAGLAASVAAANLAAPALGLVAWTLLFGSLGWNFLDYGLTTSEGAIPGWIICGVVFELMALPALLVVVIPRFAKLGSSTGGSKPEGSAIWWGTYAALGIIGMALGVWSFYSWR